jgi:16S rRNA (guanine966-N2)-methyltransferase
MRIIGGKFKGRPIEFIKSSITRPLKNSVKESIFNIIIHSKKINIDIINSKILDLYSGIGSFGIEAISRGAKKVTFIEKNKFTINILKKNIKNFSIQEKTRLIENDVYAAIKNNKIEKFDLLFLDPPFRDDSFINIIELIKIKKNYNKKSIIIIHREKKTNDNLKKLLSIFLVKTYGRSKILFANFLT